MPAQHTHLLAGSSLQALGVVFICFHNGKEQLTLQRGMLEALLLPAASLSPSHSRCSLARTVLPKSLLVGSQCSCPQNFFPANFKKHVLHSKCIASSEQLSSFYFRDTVSHIFFFGLAARSREPNR